jgi:hypothetical protein
MGPSYFEEESIPKAAPGIKPLKRAPANAAPPPSREDFIRILRLKFRLAALFPRSPLFFRCIDLSLARFYHGGFSGIQIRNPEMDSISNFAGAAFTSLVL